MVGEADGESEMLFCEKGISQGGVEGGGGKWEKRKGGRDGWGKGNVIVGNVNFQSEWTINRMQDL